MLNFAIILAAGQQRLRKSGHAYTTAYIDMALAKGSMCNTVQIFYQ